MTREMQVYDLRESHIGATVAFSTMLRWEGELVACRPDDDRRFGWLKIVVSSRIKANVLVRLQAWVDLTPVPLLKSGDRVTRSGYSDPASKWYHIPWFGEILKISKDSAGRVVFQVQWDPIVDPVWMVRRNLQLLTPAIIELEATLAEHRSLQTEKEQNG